MHHMIEAYNNDSCPQCGGHLSCTLQGSVYGPGETTQYDKCVCDACGRGFKAKSKEYHVGYETEDGFRMHGLHQWACPACEGMDFHASEPEKDRDGRYYIRVHCNGCGHESTVFHLYESGGTAFENARRKGLLARFKEKRKAKR